MSGPTTSFDPAACPGLAIELAGPVLSVRLDRPEVRNAFDAATIDGLRRIFEAAAGHDDCRVVVISGTGPAFCAGADLGWMKAAADYSMDQNLADATRLAEMLAAVRDCPKPVVAKVHGAAMGGGAGLIAAADVAVAASDTRFAFSEVRLGLVPAVISPFVIPRIGISASREKFLTGEVFDADEALRIGLVHHVVPPDELADKVAERVDALLQGGPGAHATVKRLLTALTTPHSDVTALTAAAIAERRASGEGKEGMTAFFEGRAPVWRIERQEPS